MRMPGRLATTVLALGCSIGACARSTPHAGTVASGSNANGGPEASNEIAFVDVNLVTTDEPVARAEYTIVARGSRIERVGPSSEVHVPPGVRRVTGAGALYAVAGLSDVHVHLDLEPERWLPLFLACGVTTVLNLHGMPRHLELRAAVRSGAVLGPTVFTAGPYANQPSVMTPADAERLVAAEKSAGYDVIKIHGDLTREAFERLVAEGHRRGIEVVGHAPRNLPFDAVLDVGMRSVVHAEELIYTHFKTATDRTPDRVNALGTRMRERRVWLTPTLAMQRSLVAQWGRLGAIDAMMAKDPAARFLTFDIRNTWHVQDAYGRRSATKRAIVESDYQFLRQLVPILHAEGVRLVLGTDSPLPGMVPGSSLLDEIAILSDVGIDRRAVLHAATVNAGEYIGELVPSADRFGRIEPGWRADLVLFARNPLQVTPTCEDVRGVLVRGRWLDANELRRLREAVPKTPSLATRGAVVPRAALEAHVGTFANDTLRIRIELVEGALVLVGLPPGVGVRLVAASSTEFHALDNLAPISVHFDDERVFVDIEDDDRFELRRCSDDAEPRCPPQPR